MTSGPGRVQQDDRRETIRLGLAQAKLGTKLSLEKQKGAGHARFIILVKDVCLLRDTKVLSTVGNISRFTKDQHNCDLEDRLERDHSGC